MDYMEEFEFVDEEISGFSGSSPTFHHNLVDELESSDFPSSPPGLREPSADEVAYQAFLDSDDGDNLGYDHRGDVRDDYGRREEIEIDSADSTYSVDESDETAGISIDSWDNRGGDNDSSLRSTSPSDSIDLTSLIEPEHLQDHDRESSNPVSVSVSPASVEVEREVIGLDLITEDEEEQGAADLHPFERWEQQHRDLLETRQRVAESLRELRGQRLQEQSRFWNDTLGRHRERRERRRSIMSGSSARARPEASPSPPRPRDSDNRHRARRAERAQRPMRDELVHVEVDVPSQFRRRQIQSSAGPARPRAVGLGRQREASAFQAAPPAFIDLTEEPDSPEDPRNANGPSTIDSRAPGRLPSAASFHQLTLPSTSNSATRHTNPRRQMSLNHRTPSLTRSDASLLGNRPAPPAPADVIDLTMDDDPPPRRTNTNHVGARLPFPPPPRRHGRQLLPTYINPIEVDDEQPPQDPGIFGLFSRIGFGIGALWGNTVIDMQALPNPNPLGDNRPNFNYQANGYNSGGRASSKPVHEPPAKAREGFTRNTASAGEDAFVCPACEEELAYDPDEEGPGTPGKDGPPPKRARTRKDREEHHFWAVKECGHVFCKKCYDGRKPTKTHKTLFRTDPKSPRKVFCPVDDCKSEVSNKTAWVGLFL